MSDNNRFERIEKKYLVTEEQYWAFMPRLLEYMQPDQYGESTICNLYLDTEDDLLVRRSIEKPRYKEKMRLRSYGIPEAGGLVYLEIKKKTGGVVYKRRVSLTVEQAMAYLTEGGTLENQGQIGREIDYMKNLYGLYPKEYLAYDRVAYTEIEPGPQPVRLTIDRNIRSRETDVDLRLGDAGTLLLPKGTRLMEIKISGAYPLWLSEALCIARLFPCSFSKYGQVYQKRCGALSALNKGWRAVAAVNTKPYRGGFSNAYSPV